MELGCIVRPRTSVIPRHEQALGRIYKIHELLDRPSGENKDYMPASSYEKIYLLHASSGARHIWGLFIHATKDITFYVVNPIANKSQN